VLDHTANNVKHDIMCGGADVLWLEFKTAAAVPAPFIPFRIGGLIYYTPLVIGCHALIIRISGFVFNPFETPHDEE